MSIRKLLFSIAAIVTVSAANCAVAHAAEGPEGAITAVSSETQPQTEENAESEETKEPAGKETAAEKDKKESADKAVNEAADAQEAVQEEKGEEGDLVLFTDPKQDLKAEGAAAAVYGQAQDENAAGLSGGGEKAKDTAETDSSEEAGNKEAAESGKTEDTGTAEEAKNTEDAKKQDDSEKSENAKSPEAAESEAAKSKDTKSEEPKKSEAQKDSKSSEKNEEKETGKKEKPAYTKEDLKLLTCLVYAEAGNQSYKGKLAVANVVLNRKNNRQSHMFGHANTIKAVVYDKKWGVQFSVTKGGSNSSLAKALKMYETGKYSNKAEKKAMQECEKAAKAAFEGENNIGDYLFFRMYNKATAKKYSDHLIIEDHIFYNAN